MAYFDFNATTPLNTAGRQSLVESLDSVWANPSSPYTDSARVHNRLEEARQSLSDRFGGSLVDIVFTGGATEANNSIIQYLASKLPESSDIAQSPFEHPSVSVSAETIMKGRVHLLKSTPAGQIDLGDLTTVLDSGKIAAVSLMAVNNESGVIQPWQEAAKLCREAGVLFHCDASQWFGKCEGYEFSHCDFLVGCGHKFGGPKGVGFVALSANCHGFQSQFGGGQESGRRGGTENVPSILSMVAALGDAESHLEKMRSQELFRDQFEKTLTSSIPGLKFIGQTVIRVPNTSFLIMPRFENVRWARKLDLRGFQVSTGSACSTGSAEVSPLLAALGYANDESRRTIRVSSGPDMLESDWESLAGAFEEVWDEMLESGNASNTEVISI